MLAGEGALQLAHEQPRQGRAVQALLPRPQTLPGLKVTGREGRGGEGRGGERKEGEGRGGEGEGRGGRGRECPYWVYLDLNT